MSAVIPIMTRYPGFCRRCNNKVEVGTIVWWEPGFGVVHQECYGMKQEAGLIREHVQRPRKVFDNAEIEIPEKWAYDIDAGKKRIESARKRLGWPVEDI